jgi:glycosyltransferase involved in cell wall biosynthesis
MTDPRVAVVTDSIDDVNGLALGLRRLAAASARAGLPLFLVGAGLEQPVTSDEAGVVRVPTHFRHSLSIYPEMTWGVPCVLPLARWLEEARIDLVQCATPGPMGLAALAAARALGLPVIAQYHTEVPDYAARMTGRPELGALAARGVSWFYRKADLCLAPSAATAERLIGYGVRPSRIRRVPRGVDIALFRPELRDRKALARFGLGGGPVLLYLGRLSREKNLPVLLEAHARVRAACPEAQLLLVGDGPIARSLGGEGVVRAGTLLGEELARVVASADVFVFPSETETFGNVVVEAQAAGLPVVVARGGAAHEQVLEGTTGLVTDGRPEAFAAAVLELLEDPERRGRMGAAAHDFARRYDPDVAARGTFAIYREVLCNARSSSRPGTWAAPGSHRRKWSRVLRSS